MSRDQKWQTNRPIRNKTSLSSKKPCTSENRQTKFDWSNEELNKWQTYEPLVEILKTGKVETISSSYQTDQNRCNILGENGNLVSVVQNKAASAWDNHQHGKEAVHIHQNAIVNQRLNMNQTIYKPEDEEFSVWKAYKPILEKEEPMEVDQEEPNWLKCPAINTGCNVFGGIGNLSTLQKSTSINHQHGNEAMNIYQNANVYMHQQILNNGQIAYKPEEFSVWKACKPILDKEEPMEVDQEITWPLCPEVNTQFNILAENGKLSNTIQTIYGPEEFSVLKAYKPISDSEEPMEIDDGDETCQSPNTIYDFLQCEQEKNMLLFWESLEFELAKNKQTDCDERNAEKFRDETTLAISSPENLQDSDFEIFEENEDQDYYLTDEEFQLWLQEEIIRLEQVKEDGDK